MKKFIYKINQTVLTWFGNVKIFRFPFFLVYDPDNFAVDGDHVMRVLETAKPGDVFLRGYRHYLDGYFIPGDYSHGGLYMGNGKVIHATSIGVNEVNAIDFMACDRIMVVRPSHGQEKAMEIARKFLADNIPYDFGFKRGLTALYCFELAAEAYPDLDIQRKQASILGGLIKRKDPVYLSTSFTESKDFTKVLEFNPLRKVDFVVQGS